jgi:hypothetical protein
LILAVLGQSDRVLEHLRHGGFGLVGEPSEDVHLPRVGLPPRVLLGPS